ncbi:hypothetical protein ACFVUW_28830 [Streptomyces xiamenensis]|uniref:hypothetical protein n=1 Tax=Streptomyces xiamenensis TaxID=408015 RepID=UPI0036E86FAB
MSLPWPECGEVIASLSTTLWTDVYPGRERDAVCMEIHGIQSDEVTPNGATRGPTLIEQMSADKLGPFEAIDLDPSRVGATFLAAPGQFMSSGRVTA